MNFTRNRWLYSNLLLALVLFLFCRPVLYCQKHNFLKYSVTDGLPQSQVSVLAQDSIGYLWIGTEGGGLSRFDGKEFENFSINHGLSSNYINDIQVDNSGMLWIATSKGLSSYESNEIKSNEVNGLNIKALQVFQDSLIVMATDDGLYVYNKYVQNVFKLKVEIDLNAVKINDLELYEYGFILATSAGLYNYDGQNIHELQLNTTLKSKNIKAVTKGLDGPYWLSVMDYGVVKLDETLTVDQVYPYDKISHAQYCLAQKTIWVGTQDNGLAILDETENSWSYISEKNGLNHNNVRSIYQDQMKQIWIATAGGLSKYLGQDFIHFNSSDGLQGDRIYALTQDRLRKIWLAVSGEGVATIDGDTVEANIDSSRITSKINDIYQDSQNRMWFATSGQGVWINQDSLWTQIDQSDGLPSDWVQSVVEQYGTYYIATLAAGIVLMNEKDSSRFIYKILDKSHGLPDLEITNLKNHDGKSSPIWFTTKKGAVGTIVKSNVHGYVFPSGVSIKCLTFDDQGHVFIGTSGEGIYYANIESYHQGFKQFDNSKLQSLNIYLLEFDNQGHLWAGSEKGVERISLDKMMQISEVKSYSKNEGFLGIETCQSAVVKDHQGSLWFGTLNGVTKYQLSETESSIALPNVHLKSISVFYKNLLDSEFAADIDDINQIEKQIVLPRNQNHLSFYFGCVDLSTDIKARYQWRLVGSNADWSPPSEQSSINISNLNHGEYEFELKAINKHGIESQVVSVPFKIKKALWEELWFKITGVALLSLLVFWYVKTRINGIRKKAEQKNTSLKLENELLQLEQKALQLQMNPHFVFNALNSIQGLVAMKKTEEARTQLQNFASMMRGLLTNSRKELISLKDEIDTLVKYIEMEHFCQNEPFEYRVNVKGVADPESIMIPPMLVQPFIENAIIHGFKNLPRPAKLDISFVLKEDLMTCIINDNGVGRKKSEQNKNNIKAGHQSLALKVNEERLLKMKGTNNYIPMHIKDLIVDGFVLGTQVTLKFPIVNEF